MCTFFHGLEGIAMCAVTRCQFAVVLYIKTIVISVTTVQSLSIFSVPTGPLNTVLLPHDLIMNPSVTVVLNSEEWWSFAFLMENT
jgi:hypothetical protein